MIWYLVAYLLLFVVACWSSYEWSKTWEGFYSTESTDRIHMERRQKQNLKMVELTIDPNMTIEQVMEQAGMSLETDVLSETGLLNEFKGLLNESEDLLNNSGVDFTEETGLFTGETIL